jgi:hypothetical protein
VPSITLPLPDAKDMIAALLPHVAADIVTPVLTCVAVGGERFGQFAYATDRYTMGRYDLTNITDPVEEEVLIPREALAWVRSLGPKSLLYGGGPDYKVTFYSHVTARGEHRCEVRMVWHPGDPDHSPEEHALRVFKNPGASGHFPPSSRLFDEFLPGEVSRLGIGATQIGKFTDYARRHHPAPMRVTLPKVKPSSRGLDPVLIEIGRRFKGLLAPNLILDSTGFGHDLAEANAAKAKESEPTPEEES